MISRSYPQVDGPEGPLSRQIRRLLSARPRSVSVPRRLQLQYASSHNLSSVLCECCGVPASHLVSRLYCNDCLLREVNGELQAIAERVPVSSKELAA